MIYFVRQLDVKLTILSLEARGDHRYRKESDERICLSSVHSLFKNAGIFNR